MEIWDARAKQIRKIFELANKKSTASLWGLNWGEQLKTLSNKYLWVCGEWKRHLPWEAIKIICQTSMRGFWPISENEGIELWEWKFLTIAKWVQGLFWLILINSLIFQRTSSEEGLKLELRCLKTEKSAIRYAGN